MAPFLFQPLTNQPNNRSIKEESLENVDDSCWELLRAGMLDGFGADDMVCESELTDQAIIHMETRFQKGMKELLEFLANFIP